MEMTDKEYFALPALSASQIKTFNIGGRYDFWKTSPFNPEKKPDVENDAMIFGSYCHCCLLEPEEVSKRYLVLDWGTKTRGTKKFTDAVAANPGLVLISPDEQAKAEKMVAALKEHKVASKYLDGCVTETPVVWKDEKSEIMCKAKIDALKVNSDGSITIVDYKTSSDIDGVLNKGEHFQYPLQAEFYKRAVKARFGNDKQVDFVFIIQSSKEDEADKIAVAFVNDETQKVAEVLVDNTIDEIKYLLEDYDAFKDKQVFAAYPDLMEISYSQWYLNGNHK